MTLTFADAAVADADEVAVLVRSAYRDEDAGGWTTEAHLLADERIDADRVSAKIARPDTTVLVARDDAGQLVACCEVVDRGDGLAYFGMFAVRPALQAAGVGRQVLAAAEALAAKRLRATRMEMTVIGQRADLIDWYVRRGYERTNEQRPFPYDDLLNGEARRDDLYFCVLTKALAATA